MGNYSRIENKPKWISADMNSGIQLSDCYAGILGAAMIADRYGNFEPSYLEKIKQGKICGFGIKALSRNNNPKTFK